MNLLRNIYIYIHTKSTKERRKLFNIFFSDNLPREEVIC